MDINNGQKSNDKKEDKPSPSKSPDCSENGIDPQKPPPEGTASKDASKRNQPKRPIVKMPMMDLQSDKGESIAGGVVEMEPDMPDLVEATIPDAVDEAQMLERYVRRLPERLPEPVIVINRGRVISDDPTRGPQWRFQILVRKGFDLEKHLGLDTLPSYVAAMNAEAPVPERPVEEEAHQPPANAEAPVPERPVEEETHQPPANAEAPVPERPVTLEALYHPEAVENSVESGNDGTDHEDQVGDTPCDDATISDVGNEQESGTPNEQQTSEDRKVGKKTVTFQDQQPPQKDAEKHTEQISKDANDTKESATDAAKTEKKTKKRARKHRKGKKHV